MATAMPRALVSRMCPASAPGVSCSLSRIPTPASRSPLLGRPWARPADEPPVVVDVAGTKVGLMTCYDVRFPELARLLTDVGAEVLALPAAWVRGPAKERHWEVMITARALENTCWVAASGECGPRNIGNSLIVDPLGTVRSRLATAQGLAFTEADPQVTVTARSTLPVLANRRFAIDPTVRPLGTLSLGA
ncbi:nitrilase-related carbon-nitrogen hydrolase [Streptomyces sp. NPDC020792]|uniref:nitrilase-related carbon-nitrogen hydrolase n=1 Tax=Streptomyces sp. NPDC020792 TaxID=3365089 RepID=UPI00379D0337